MGDSQTNFPELITSGIENLDNLIGSFAKSDLIVLASRPSIGKTTLALKFAYHAASHGGRGGSSGTPVAIFSLEMSEDQIKERLRGVATAACSESGALECDLSALKIFIDDTPQLAINQIRSRARRLTRQENIGLIVVDYLQLMRGSVQANDSRASEISEISQGLKALARELDIPVMVLSQLSRDVESRENKRPLLSDFQETGSLEQDADVVMFLYRDAYYKERDLGANATASQLAELDEIKNKVEILVAKNNSGRTGQVLCSTAGQSSQLG